VGDDAGADAYRSPNAVISVLDAGFCRLDAASGLAQRGLWASDLRITALHRSRTMVDVTFFDVDLGFRCLDQGFLRVDLLFLELNVGFLCLTWGMQ
jgi:hypothetical protein